MTDAMQGLVDEGGWVLIVIGVVSILAWTLVFLAWQQVAHRTVGGWSSIDVAVDHLQRGSRVDPRSLERTGDNLVANVLRSEVLQANHSRASFESQVGPLLRSESLMFQQRLRMISVLAATMPLLGLLGTVLGMIQTFDVLVEPGGVRADSLADGVSQALITTQAGLVIAVPVLLAHGYLRSRIRRYLDKASVMVKKIETAVCSD